MMFLPCKRILRAPGVAAAFALAILPGALSAATPGGPPGGPPPTAAPNAGSSPPPTTPINAPPPAVAADDCTPLPVSLPPGTEELTREERLERLDRALNESLARFAKCQGGGGGGTIAQQPGGGQGAPPATAGSSGAPGEPPPTVAGGNTQSPPGGPPPGSGEGTQEPSNETPIPSVAARGIRGPGDITSSEGEPTVASAPGNTPPTPGGAPGLPSPSGEGDVPEDIPSGDNDGVLEAQIRRAAMAETDPKRKAELWNEYRRYKGLPTKPVAEAKPPQPTAEAKPQ